MGRALLLLLLASCAESPRLVPECLDVERACVGDDSCHGRVTRARFIGTDGPWFVETERRELAPAYFAFLDDGQVCALLCCDGDGGSL